MVEKKKGKWIKKAINPEHKGEFKAKAQKAGKTTEEFAVEHKHDSGKLGKEARLASTLMGMHHKKKVNNLHEKMYK